MIDVLIKDECFDQGWMDVLIKNCFIDQGWMY